MSYNQICSEHRLRAQRVFKKTTELRTLRDRLQQDLDLRLNEIEVLSRRMEVLGKVGELFRALMDRLVMDHVKSIESVVTEALRSIFIDQDLWFEAEVSQRYNKMAIDFFIRQEDKRMSIKAHPLDGFGGGPTSIAALVLKVLAMRRLNKWPLIALDETLGGVSDEYVDRTGMFLRELAQKTGFSFLLISHKQAFLEHAKIGYRASEMVETDGARHLTLQKEN
jgi:hypothetical protein